MTEDRLRVMRDKWQKEHVAKHDAVTVEMILYSELWDVAQSLAAAITDREGKYVDLLRTKHALAAEVEPLKETNSRLNRRCQAAEAGVRENVEACRKAGVSLGRALANGGYRMMEEKIDSLRDLVREADVLIQEEIRQCSVRYPELTSEHVRTCGVCKELYAWVEKAAKV